MKDKFEMLGGKIAEFQLPNSRGETKGPQDFAGKQNLVIILLRDIH